MLTAACRKYIGGFAKKKEEENYEIYDIITFGINRNDVFACNRLIVADN